MSDEHENFGAPSAMENELRRYAAVVPRDELVSQIAAALEARAVAVGRTRGDRFLMGAMALGAAAAVVNVALISLDFFDRSNERLAMTAQSLDTPTISEQRELLALLAAGKNPFDPLPTAAH